MARERKTEIDDITGVKLYEGNIPIASSPRGWLSERPSDDPTTPEIWCYTNRLSYSVFDRLDIHVHTTARRFSLRVFRDSVVSRTVLARSGLPGTQQDTPHDAYAVGCGWATSLSTTIPEDWEPGVYVVTVDAVKDGIHVDADHCFVLRPPTDSMNRLALLLTTSTMVAYNDWGGANAYHGIGDDPKVEVASPILAIQRPIARGMVRKPESAPRESNAFTPPPFWKPKYESYQWARENGFSRHHANAFWATFERPFSLWAESSGYSFDVLTQHDIHVDPKALTPYACLMIAGHDEYWSWEMRDALDEFVEGGGNLARFAGNFMWQVRIEGDGERQVCYKLPEADPLNGTASEHLVTTLWDHPIVGRPAVDSMGLSGMGGIYARYGAATPRSPGGYTVYRPDHWAFSGTDLYYGDQLGGPPSFIAAYEVDGIEYTFEKGLPFPAATSGAPADLEILAMAPAVLGEEDRWGATVPLGGPIDELEALSQELWGESRRYGAGMMATFSRGRGSVFNAGTTEWVRGLISKDFFVERVTQTVLNRFLDNRR